MPTFVIGGLRGSTAISGSCIDKSLEAPCRKIPWSPRTKPALGNALLTQFSHLQPRCSTLCSGPQSRSPAASSLPNEQRRLIFGEEIEIFQVKAWLAAFKARIANLKLLDDRRKKKIQLDQPADGVQVRLRRLIVDLLSLSRCRSRSKSVVFRFFKFVAP